MLEGALLRWDFKKNFFCMARKQMGGLCLEEMVKSKEIWPLVHILCGLFFQVLYYFQGLGSAHISTLWLSCAQRSFALALC